ncbi:uncharacterized protein JCM6883_007072 [Sporobolomyces salmoneus]|uniref:uncharacterized protein n=1 Tax=Sporobolomyces salmoneus TaxID=183962 RepID=UPI0031705F2A
MGFLTSSALVSSSFLLGNLFTGILWDSSVLFGLKEPISRRTIEAIESYYLTWWNGPMAVKMFLHVMMLVLFLSIVAKFARYTDTAYYFSGGSILLLILTASVYIVITIPSIRTIAADPLNKDALILPGLDFFTRFQNLFVRHSTGTLAERARETAKKLTELGPMSWEERLIHVQVLCAGNVIAAGLLVGVVLLQAGESYLEEDIRAEELEELKKQLAPTPVTEEKKTQ